MDANKVRRKILDLATEKLSKIPTNCVHKSSTVDMDAMIGLVYEQLASEEYDLSTCLRNVQAVIDRAWEYLNIGHWKDISDDHRRRYALASLLKVITLLKLTASTSNEEIWESELQKAISAADMGLMMGCSYREELSDVAYDICEILPKQFELEIPVSHEIGKRIEISDKCDIPILHRPSLETFYKSCFSLKTPAKLRDCIAHWPALEKWHDFNYIMKEHGRRTVPVEIGSSYAAADWSQKLITIADFVRNYVLSSGENQPKATGYLAQHTLFEQIPQLLDDVREPEYCSCSEIEDDAAKPDINIWFGPANTVSPLHYDPKHNLLVQVVGSKRIFLFDPKDSIFLYPHEDDILFNTSEVDVEAPDLEKFPNFKQAKKMECVLNAGDILYIPPKWWHHVRSLSPSISVSFWWE